MSVIFALVRKDLRRLRWPWLGWLGCFLAKLALAAWCVAGPGFNETDVMRMNIVFTALAALVGAVLVVWLVQADSLQRVHAFWRTRPVSGGQLLVAKGLSAFLLFGLAPVLLTLPWWLFNGMGASGLAWSVAEMLLAHAAVFAPVFLIAALVDSVSRAVLWSFVQFGFLMCLPLLADALWGATSYLDLERGLDLSRVVLAAAVVALGLPALTAWQFMRRRTVAVAVGLLVLQVTAFGIARFSPYNLVQPSAIRSELIPERVRDVALQSPAAKFEKYRVREGSRDMAVVRSTWPVVGLPHEIVAFPSLSTCEVTDSRGRRIGARRAMAQPGTALRFGAVFPLLGLELPVSPDSSTIQVGFAVAQTQALELKREPLSMSVGLQVRLCRPEVVFDHALASREWRADEHGAMRIEDVHVTMSGVDIKYVITQPKSVLSLVRDNWNLARSRFFPFSGCENCVIDPSARQPSSLPVSRGELRILGVGIQRLTWSLSPERVFRDGVWKDAENVDIAAWSADLRMARIAYRKEASLSLAGRAEGIVIDGYPVSSGTGKN